MGEGTFVNRSYSRSMAGVKQAGRVHSSFDWVLLGTIIGLILFGLLMVYSAGPKFAVLIDRPADYFMKRQLTFLVLLLALAVAGTAAEPAPIRVSRFLPDKPLSRARRPAPVAAILENTLQAAVEVEASLTLPPGVRIVGPAASSVVRLEAGETRRVVWNVEADEAGAYPLRLQVSAGTATVAEASLTMDFLPALEVRRLPYIPEPVPARTTVLVGAHHCPLWEADKPHMWANIVKHPERTPALGFYAQENPEVADWETKWAVEHGISFFVYCWYRTSQGGAVTTQFGSAIHDALFKSRFAGKMRFTIM